MRIRTIDTLESAAWRGVDVVTVRAEQLDGVQSGQIGAATRDDIASVAINARTRTEDAGLVLVNLRSRTNK